MPKDLISVGQGGAAIIDASTPKNITGFCTEGVETCVAIFLSGANKRGEKKYLLMHVDLATAEESIEELVRAMIKHFSVKALADSTSNPNNA